MARSRIPDPLERRHQVEGAIAPAQALATAEAYLEQGRSVEAVDYLRIAEASDRLDELRQNAIGRGDVFLLRAVAEAQEVPPTRDEWRRTAESAERNGLERYAVEARRQAERGD